MHNHGALSGHLSGATRDVAGSLPHPLVIKFGVSLAASIEAVHFMVLMSGCGCGCPSIQAHDPSKSTLTTRPILLPVTASLPFHSKILPLRTNPLLPSFLPLASSASQAEMSALLAARRCSRGSKIKLLAATLTPPSSSSNNPFPSPPSQSALPHGRRPFPLAPAFPRLPAYHHHHHHHHHHHPHVPPLCSFHLPPSSSYSTTSPSHSDKPPHNPPTDYPSQNPNFKHQEIEGPTVERDLSALANETRQVLEDLMKTLYSSSKAIAALGLLQLALGAWISYLTRSSPIFEASLLGCVAFGFPFSLAFLLRQCVKPILFFFKMEQLGRLQILTLSLQVAKSLNLFFVRARGVSYFCAAALSLGVLFTLLSR